MKRYILKNEETFPSQIFGLVCTKPITQLVWDLSSVFELSFERKPDLTHAMIEKNDYWPHFSYHDSETETTYSIVRNKGTNLQLAPELRTIDVFLVETNPSLTFHLTQDKLSKTRFVDFCFVVKNSMISQETEFILQLE